MKQVVVDNEDIRTVLSITTKAVTSAKVILRLNNQFEQEIKKSTR